MNKIIFNHKQKGLIVISSSLLVIFLFSFTTLNSKKSTANNNDYVLVNKILEKTRKQKKGRIIQLNPINDNTYVISLINNIYKCETKKLDSLKKDNGIDDITFENVFNKKEYTNYISQKINLTWNLSKIQDKSIKMSTKENLNYKYLSVYISKPIYSLNKKFCLVYIKSTWSGIMIYKKEKGIWKDYKLISAMLN